MRYYMVRALVRMTVIYPHPTLSKSETGTRHVKLTPKGEADGGSAGHTKMMDVNGETAVLSIVTDSASLRDMRHNAVGGRDVAQ